MLYGPDVGVLNACALFYHQDKTLQDDSLTWHVLYRGPDRLWLTEKTSGKRRNPAQWVYGEQMGSPQKAPMWSVKTWDGQNIVIGHPKLMGTAELLCEAVYLFPAAREPRDPR